MPSTVPAWAPKPAQPAPMADVVFHEDDEDEEDEGPGVITFHPAPLVVENRHNLPKKAGDTLLTAGSLGISATQFGTGLSSVKTVAALVGGVQLAQRLLVWPRLPAWPRSSARLCPSFPP